MYQRWQRWYRLEKSQDGSDPGNLDPNKGEDGKETDPNNSQDRQTLSEGQSPFSNPTLAKRFKSEADLAEFLSVQESTLRSNRQRLTAIETELQNSRNAPPPKDEEIEEIDPRKFFEAPGENITKIVKNVIEKELKNAVAPLVADVRNERVKGVWGGARSKFKNFDRYEDAVREKIKSFGVDESRVTEELIEEVYTAVIGRAVLDGGYFPDEESDRGRGGNGNQGGQGQQRLSPQHRASSQPSRPENRTEEKIELSEEEKRLARMQFRGSKDPYGEYIKWSKMEEANIADFVEEESK